MAASETKYKIARSPGRNGYHVNKNVWDFIEGRYQGWYRATGQLFKTRHEAREFVIADLYPEPDK